MNAFMRFVTLGMRDADARVAAFLSPGRWNEADAYLRSSVLIGIADRFTERLQQYWSSSESARLLNEVSDEFGRQDWRGRYHALAVVLLTAVGVNVLLTMVQGPRPGWFWAVMPLLVGAFALVLLAASVSKPRA